jgi:hypothetical protein
MVSSMFRRISAELLDRADYLLTLARLMVLDWIPGPGPETPVDRAIREEGERLRNAFLWLDEGKRRRVRPRRAEQS